MRALWRRVVPHKSGILTGVAACLFAAGVVSLFATLYRNASHGGPLLWTAFGLLIATVVCWFAAAYTHNRPR